jgi:FMN phosphatase YigB (HAD superfamily)
MKNELIIVDVDGVLLNWEWGFRDWMKSTYPEYKLIAPNEYDVGLKYGITRAEGRKLVSIFNSSANIGFLNPYKDAIKYVRKLKEEGYMFWALTSLTLNPYAQELRKKNLVKLFGNVFVEYTILATGQDKDGALQEIENKYPGENLYWVEDKAENAEMGKRIGLDPIVMAYPHNADYEGKRVYNWLEIYAMVTQ